MSRIESAPRNIARMRVHPDVYAGMQHAVRSESLLGSESNLFLWIPEQAARSQGTPNVRLGIFRAR